MVIRKSEEKGKNEMHNQNLRIFLSMEIKIMVTLRKEKISDPFPAFFYFLMYIVHTFSKPNNRTNKVMTKVHIEQIFRRYSPYKQKLTQ